MYGYREVIVDGGLTMASTDPAYLRLTQLPATENLLTVIGNSETDSGGIYRGGFDVGGDGSQGYTVEKNVFVGFSSPTNYELRIYASSVSWGGPSYLQQLASQLVVGEIVTITVTTYNYGFYGTRILEYLGSDLGHYGTTRLRFADTAGMSTSDSYHNFQLEAIRPVENYDVLDTFTGSEGMIRFHPLTKTFEGHDGTAWAPLGGGDITVTASCNIYSCISGNGGTGCSNNFFGSLAGYSNTSGSCNNFFGQYAGRYNTTGCNNFFAGLCAGFCATTGINNIFIGCNSGVGSAGLANITNESNRIIMGNSSHTCAQIQIGWSTVSDIRDKCIFGPVPHGRSFLENINPITYAFKNRETDELSDPPNRQRYGFSAQELLSLEGDNPVIVGIDNPDKLNLTSDYLIPILVNGFKELSQEIENLKQEIATLKNNQQQR